MAFVVSVPIPVPRFQCRGLQTTIKTSQHLKNGIKEIVDIVATK